MGGLYGPWLLASPIIEALESEELVARPLTFWEPTDSEHDSEEDDPDVAPLRANPPNTHNISSSDSDEPHHRPGGRLGPRRAPPRVRTAPRRLTHWPLDADSASSSSFSDDG